MVDLRSGSLWFLLHDTIEYTETSSCIMPIGTPYVYLRMTYVDDDPCYPMGRYIVCFYCRLGIVKWNSVDLEIIKGCFYDEGSQPRDVTLPG